MMQLPRSTSLSSMIASTVPSHGLHPMAATKGTRVQSHPALDVYATTSCSAPAVPVSFLANSRASDATIAELFIGAHRGMGENNTYAATTVFRENTILSLKQAATCGASFVEFDVQVTKDGMPVIWHDDYVLTGDPHSPSRKLISELTLNGFKQLISKQQPTLLRDFKDGAGGRSGLRPWLVQQEDELPTLAEVFADLPANVGFDIEVKMTTPDDKLRTSPQEVNRMVQPILDVVTACAGDRAVVFSSFDPEVCIALRERQSRHPVLFLSGGGAYTHVDVRRTSVAAAIDFAAAHALQGVVFETGALRANEGQVANARAKGLVLYTYGQQNNDPFWLQRQQVLGVRGAIVDDVPGVISALHFMRTQQAVQHGSSDMQAGSEAVYAQQNDVVPEPAKASVMA